VECDLGYQVARRSGTELFGRAPKAAIIIPPSATPGPDAIAVGQNLVDFAIASRLVASAQATW
jgi:hypothetical protein